MNLPCLEYITTIEDRLNELSTVLKFRSRASLSDANRELETTACRFLNALFSWKLLNLNTEHC
jgi:hypothetical protein